MRRNPLRAAFLIAALATSAALVSSCSKSPVAPVLGDSPSGRMNSAKWVDPESLPPTVEPVSELTTRTSASTTRTINGLLGGQVAAGDFRVVFPPGSILGTAQVTVTQADLSAKEVELEISPPSANAFLVPVLLVADCREMKPQILKLQTIYWWNPDTSRWQAVPGVVVNLLGRSVQVPLWHFSKYKVEGKAGW